MICHYLRLFATCNQELDFNTQTNNLTHDDFPTSNKHAFDIGKHSIFILDT